MKKLKLLLFGLALSALPVFAQPETGDWEFTLGGSGSADDDFDTGGFGVNGSFGYFINQNFEASIRQTVNFVGDRDEEWSGSTRAAIDWHFLLGKFVPFIGANGGLTYTEDDARWSIAPEIGMKYFVHDKTFIFALGEYRWFPDGIRNFGGNFDHGNFLATIGIGFNLGGRR